MKKVTSISGNKKTSTRHARPVARKKAILARRKRVIGSGKSGLMKTVESVAKSLKKAVSGRSR